MQPSQVTNRFITLVVKRRPMLIFPLVQANVCHYVNTGYVASSIQDCILLHNFIHVCLPTLAMPV